MKEDLREEIEIRDGQLVGPLRAPVNPMRKAEGSIHDEGEARKLGFRGGLVAGSIHMEQLAPVLVRAFGEAWLERGTISLYFLTPTLHGEEVRAVIEAPPADPSDTQVEAWMEKADGTRICEGTASIGSPLEPSALHARKLDKHASGELRILEGATRGDEFPMADTSVPHEKLDERLKVITEPMHWYIDDSRWTGRVATMVNQVNALMAPADAYLREMRAGAIGLYGAIELRNVSGPMLVDTPYRSGGTLLHAGETPKTEYLWFDTWADDESHKRIVEMRLMLRFMKASSKKYAEATAGAATA
ncbi:MAG: hypothetical protein IH865_11740 [Chloroflexi bacterium]|nr:hypothetical protein [Chloroflexota bacterium]